MKQDQLNRRLEVLEAILMADLLALLQQKQVEFFFDTLLTAISSNSLSFDGTVRTCARNRLASFIRDLRNDCTGALIFLKFSRMLTLTFSNWLSSPCITGLAAGIDFNFSSRSSCNWL
jgi:hypothetical protein